MEPRRSKVSQIPEPIYHAKVGVRKMLEREVALRGIEAMGRAKRMALYARHEPRPEARVSLLDQAKRHEFQVERAAASRWLRARSPQGA